MAPRLLPASQLGAADGLSMVAAQALQLAYQIGQPPLYDWSVWLIQQATGPTVFGTLLPKYLYCLAAGLFAYGAVRRASGDPRLGLLASLAVLLLFNVGITIHDLSTHSVPMLTAITGTFYFFVRVLTEGRTRDYLGLGAMMAVGLLSKYGFALTPAGLFAAALLSPAARPRIIDRRMLLALAIPLLLVLPFALWVAANRDAFAAKAATTLIGKAGTPHWLRALDGLKDMAGSYAVYATPAIPALWLCWPRLLGRRLRAGELTGGGVRGVLALALMIAAGLMAGGIVVAGLDIMRSRYMHAVALLLPLLVVLFLEPADLTRRRIGLFVAIVITVHAVTAGSRALIPFFPVKPFCSTCDVIQPVDRLAAHLVERGFERAIVMADDHQLAGNLRRYLPSAAVRTSKLRETLDLSATKGCVVIDEVTGPEQASGTTTYLTVAWPPALAGPARRTTWRIVDRSAAPEICRAADRAPG